MRVAIVGGGFTGLSCAVYLADRGISPVIFEVGDHCGGLSRGFNPGGWRWHLENFYHHVFTNDKDIINLSNIVGGRLMIKKPITASFYHKTERQLDSPISVLKFSGIRFLARIHMGAGLVVLKLIPNGLFLEKFKATKALPKLLGKEGYKVIWEKLLTAKFGPFVDEVNLAWFWSRVAKRTKNLGYFEGGFQELIKKSEDYIASKGGEIRLKTPAKRIVKTDVGVEVNGEEFEAVVITVPAPLIEKIYKEVKTPQINYLWGQTLILELSKKLIKSYWLNILEEGFPFLVAVEQTNMVDKKMYGGKNIIYLGNYLAEGSKQLKMTKDQLIKLYLPSLRKINKKFSKRLITRSFLFREPFAQPVFPTNYSKNLPKTRLEKRIYMANMSMVYPFDRGTNYAVKMGKGVAETILADLR